MSELKKYTRVYDRSLHQYVMVVDGELSDCDVEEFYDVEAVDAARAADKARIERLEAENADMRVLLGQIKAEWEISEIGQIDGDLIDRAEKLTAADGAQS